MATWYRAGTVSVSNGSATVIGSGTAFSANVTVGEEFRLSGAAGGYEIAAVVSDTQLTLATPYLGSTQSGQAYEVVPVRGFLRQAYDALSGAVNQFAAYQAGALAGRFGSGTAAEPGIAFADDINTGLRRVSADQVAVVAGGVDQLSLAGGVALGEAVQTDAADTTPGKLLRVGAFGLGEDRAEVITGSVDAQMDNKGTKFFAWNTDATDVPFNYGLCLQVQAFDTTGNQLAFRRGSAPGLAFRATTDAALNFTDWMELYHTGNVLGTVGQSGGVPTGAVIERGSNGNGDYVRFADGTQICTGAVSVSSINSAFGSIYISADANWTFPAGFTAIPKAFASGPDSSNTWAGIFCDSTSVASAKLFKGTSESLSRDISVMAVGRWF